MSTYDNLAFESKPLIYFSATSLTDQISSGLFTVSANNLSLGSQPIIKGHENSFIVDSNSDLVIDENPIFFLEGRWIEFVFQSIKPNTEVGLAVDIGSLNGIYLDSEGVVLKIFIKRLEGIVSRTARVEIKDWSKKNHVTVNFSTSSAELIVNDVSSYILYDGDPTIPGAFHIGYDIENSILIDGLAFYDRKPQPKNQYINSDGSGHDIISSALFNGSTTSFQMMNPTQTFIISSVDFIRQDDFFVYDLFITEHDGENSFTMMLLDNDNVYVEYKINDEDWQQFLTVAAVNIQKGLLSIRYMDLDTPFNLTVVVVPDEPIFLQTPAVLSLTGLALYPQTVEDSVVNLPDGIKLLEGEIAGTWILGEQRPTVPKTIEMVFKAEDASALTTVYSSADGSVSFGTGSAITGFTVCLNGDVVTDLSTVVSNTWYHLVLVDPAPAATSFVLNSDNKNVSYLFLSSYTDELTLDEIKLLYNTVFSIDEVQGIESGVTFGEGTYDSGKTYRIYSYSWSVIGANG